MANITAEQALQIPQQLRKQGSPRNPPPPPPSKAAGDADSTNRILSDDAVTLQGQPMPQDKRTRIEVSQLKQALGQDMLFVRETIRTKLAEYGMHAGTRLAVEKDAFGNIVLSGTGSSAEFDRIATDLNHSKAFKDAFSRLSQQQPTLNYVDNVTKLSRAYGVENPVFRSLLSESGEFNRLSDIAHRYQSIRSSQTLPAQDTSASGGGFRLSLT
jgi:hypothetical protein